MPEAKRERFLSPSKIDWLGVALEALSDRRSADGLRLLLLTGARELEVLGAEVHDLRHTFASLVLTQTGSLPIVAQLLGHSRLATTRRYAHLADTTLRDAVDNAARTGQPP